MATRNLPPSFYRKLKSPTSSPDLGQLSYVKGPSSPPLLQSTLPGYFEHDILKRHGERTALISRHESASRLGGPRQEHASSILHWKFHEIDERIAALSRGLLKLGISRGDRVAVIMGNNSAYALLQWACARIGAILVTVNPAYRIKEIIRTLDLVKVRALFVVPQLRTSRYLDLLTKSLPSLTSASPLTDDPVLPSLRHLIVVDNTPDPSQFTKEIAQVKSAIAFHELLLWHDRTDLTSISEGLHQHDVINLQFTSGTTGAPKAVSLTHHNLLNNARSIGACMELTGEDRICNLAAWVHGASIVYASEAYDPSAVLRALYEEQCTAVHGVPTHFLGLLDALEKDKASGGGARDLSRTGIASGSPIPIDLMRQLIDKLNLRDLTIAYGMKTSPVSFQTTLHDPIVKRVESVGRPHPHVTAKIIDPSGNILPRGRPGELCVSGYLIQKGYWEDPEQTARVIRSDPNDPLVTWMHTGDTAIMDDEGYLKIVGRIKDIIIRGGENLFPVQIENVLSAHPAINEAAAVSVPDPIFGEVVGAWIGRQRGEQPVSRDDVRRWVCEEMNPQNAPAWIWFLGEEHEYEELPKTASGKVQKNVLREWSRELALRGIGKVNSPYANSIRGAS